MTTLLSINNYFYRRDGSEAVYLGHNRMFEGAGWTVVPFSMHHAENEPSPWSEFFVEELELGAAYTTAQKLRRVPKVVYSLEARRKLSALLDRVRPDVGHCHSIYHHLSPSILGVLKRRGVPVVMTLHDLKLACPAYHMFNGAGACEECKGGRLHRVLVNRCSKGSVTLSAIVMAEAVLHRLLDSYGRNVDCFVVPSEFYARKLAEWGWDASRFVHVPNFVDCSTIRPSLSPGRGFLYLGRLSPEKGLTTLLRAAAEAGAAVRLAGEGPQRAVLEREAERTGAEVEFLGRLSAERLYDAVRACRATVLPAEWYENAPISVLESFAAGKPVIGADIGGIPEIVTPGENGWLFRSGSVESLAAALREAAAAPDAKLIRMGRIARATAEARFDAVVYRRRMVSVYAALGVRVH
ncbi:MAG TPA: glycosyltransferase [Gammaproteobacteria bacterium]